MSFTTLYQLEDPIDVVLGDGRALTAVGRGDVVLDMILPNVESKACTLHDVLYVPKLSYNLLSVAKASQKGKIVKFTMSACYILNKEHKMVAKATKVGSLYQLDHEPNHERASFADKSYTKEDIWHRRFGHLGISSLQKLAREQLADGFDLTQLGSLPSASLALKENSIVPSFLQAVEGQKSLLILCIAIYVENERKIVRWS